MRRKLLSCIATACVAISLHAATTTFDGTLTVTADGVATSQETQLTLTQASDTYTLTLADLTLDGTAIGTVVIDNLVPATNGNVTVLYAERDLTIQQGSNGNSWVGPSYGALPIKMIARYNQQQGYIVATLSVTSRDVIAKFDNTSDHFQMPNSDMEQWTASTGEPDRWHGFMSASGQYAATSQKYVKLEQSSDVHSGTTGNYSAVMTAKKILFVIANGTMTNGQLIAGSMSAQSTENHAEMSNESTNTDANGDPFYMPLYAKPDSICLWLKYTQGTTNSDNKASVSAVAFDGSYYQEPYDSDYACVAGRAKNSDIAACDWTRTAIAFDYDSYAANNAEAAAIFVAFSTNATPGKGSDGDKLYVDELALIYNAAITDLCYQGTTLAGFDPAVTAYTITVESQPDLNDFSATLMGASATLCKAIETTDTGWRVVITVVSGDLQVATSYVIDCVNKSTNLVGDVNGDGTVDVQDVTALIAYILGDKPIGFIEANANINGDNTIDVQDVTALISKILGN